MVKFNLDKALHGLEIASKIGMLGFGKDISRGIIAAIFKSIDKDACYEYIAKDKVLWEDWGEEHWETMRRISKALKFEEVVTIPIVIEIIEKDRPDLLTIFKFHPKGMPWLEKQLQDMRSRIQEVTVEQQE